MYWIQIWPCPLLTTGPQASDLASLTLGPLQQSGHITASTLRAMWRVGGRQGLMQP